MSRSKPALRLLLVGVGPRLAIAGGIVALLWLGFLWATTPPGLS